MTRRTGRSVKRIHFTADDLARTRVATTIGVAAETFDSVKLLKDGDTSLAFRRWHASVRGRLAEQAGPLAALLPQRGPLLDAMSLMGDTASIDEAVDNLMTAPRALMRLELRNIDFHPAHRSWAQSLMDGDRETVPPERGPDRVRPHAGRRRRGAPPHHPLRSDGLLATTRTRSDPPARCGHPPERARSRHRADDVLHAGGRASVSAARPDPSSHFGRPDPPQELGQHRGLGGQ